MTSALYFSVLIFGVKIETNEAHGQEAGEISGSQQNETGEVVHNEIAETGNETQEKLAAEQITHNELTNSEATESPAQKALEAQETQTQQNETPIQNNSKVNEEGTTAHEAAETKGVHEESASEEQRKTLEHPLSLAAGGAYAAMGIWIIGDRRNYRVSYLIIIVGTVALLGIYAVSRTSGIGSLGTEPVGMLDIIVAILQGGIIAGSVVILVTKSYAIVE
jgi:hypothetical protein